MIRTYQYRLYPNQEQTVLLERMLEQAREVYNLALVQCENAYELSKASTEKPKMQLPTRQYPYFSEWVKQSGVLLTASAVSQVLRRADKTYKKFFRDIKLGLRAKNGGPLKIRKRKYAEYTTLDFQYGHGATWKSNPANPERRVVRLAHVGDVKVRLHRPLPDDATIKFIQVTHKASGWYACLQIETATAHRPANAMPPIGVGFGFQRLVTTSDGDWEGNPKWLRNELAKLRRLQRKFSRCQKGSKNQTDQKRYVAKLHEQVARQRRDAWHKIARQLASAFGLIVTHDADLTPLLQGKYTALPAHDAAFGILKEILSYKAEELGSQWLAIRQSGLFNICSNCEQRIEPGPDNKPPKHPMKNRLRIFRCPHCGLELERAHNAARTLLKIALREAKREESDAGDLARLQSE